MSLIISLIESAQDHYPWVLLIVFLLTFTKSCALVSLAIPGTSGLLLLGTFASASLGHFLLMWSSVSLGAIGGFWLSWRLGIRYRHRLTHLRWLTAERLARSRLFFQRYGPWAIFFSRFLSPLRATLPFVSGASSLPLWSFQLANVSSGLLWPLLLLAPGAFSLSLW
ncbi:DedA family protein [Klebsiella pneumoniae]|uniref:DedA family protein n=1 Tax=Klebsiella pneumoniae TaxID=573 RepID=UPI000E2B3C85|nr:DedA family protein [Klebsiella pneumoniae]SXN70130.1 DedA-family integral membrane protein [Klebsiella pneumoniae]